MRLCLVCQIELTPVTLLCCRRALRLAACMQVPAHARRGDASARSSSSVMHRSTDVFRERGTVTVADVQENVHSVVLALCTHTLQSIVETVCMQTLSVGAVQQCQIDLQQLQDRLAMPQLRPFFQDILSSCETRCCSANVTMLSASEIRDHNVQQSN